MSRHRKSRPSAACWETQSNGRPRPVHPLHDFDRAVPAQPSAGTPKAKRVLIVHGVPLTRFGITALLTDGGRFEVCGTVDSVPLARALFVQERPDLVLLGLTLTGGDGIQLIKDFAKFDDDARTIVFSAQEDRRSIWRAFRAGAFGYLVAHDDLSEIVTALEHAASGQRYASAAVLRHLVGRTNTPWMDRQQRLSERLSDRELQVVSLIGRGLRNARIAAELHMSVKTVESYQVRIKHKLRLRSAGELSARARQWLVHATQRGLQCRADMLARHEQSSLS
jgi:DNA-binding NarL/FixJ family response regulator